MTRKCVNQLEYNGIGFPPTSRKKDIIHHLWDQVANKLRFSDGQRHSDSLEPQINEFVRPSDLELAVDGVAYHWILTKES